MLNRRTAGLNNSTARLQRSTGRMYRRTTWLQGGRNDGCVYLSWLYWLVKKHRSLWRHPCSWTGQLGRTWRYSSSWSPAPCRQLERSDWTQQSRTHERWGRRCGLGAGACYSTDCFQTSNRRLPTRKSR